MSWDVSGVTDMSSLFADADEFNRDISQWDVSRVTNMNSMFESASSFNRDISNWDLSGDLISMKMMFHGASSFKQTLCGAWRQSNAHQDRMFTGSQGRIGDGQVCPGKVFNPSSKHELANALGECSPMDKD